MDTASPSLGGPRVIWVYMSQAEYRFKHLICLVILSNAYIQPVYISVFNDLTSHSIQYPPQYRQSIQDYQVRLGFICDVYKLCIYTTSVSSTAKHLRATLDSNLTANNHLSDCIRDDQPLWQLDGNCGPRPSTCGRSLFSSAPSLALEALLGPLLHIRNGAAYAMH